MKLYITNDEIAADLKEHVIKPVIPGKNLDKKTIFHLNPSRWFVIGGPHGDAGLTGRKIIIDTYGGWGAHGGGAFSGKDPTKVDRSGAYIVRQAARSIVASGLPRRCIVQVSYAIGVPEPLSVLVDTYGTGKIPDKEILSIVKENFDFRPGMIAISLDLKRGGNGRFLKTPAYGHFGRDGPDFTRDVVICEAPEISEAPSVKSWHAWPVINNLLVLASSSKTQESSGCFLAFSAYLFYFEGFVCFFHTVQVEFWVLVKNKKTGEELPCHLETSWDCK